MAGGTKQIYLDFDGCLVNTVKAIVGLYNQDFVYYKKFKPIEWSNVTTWAFKECECATATYINTYFNQPRFFRRLERMPWADSIIYQLLDENYKITVVSLGYSPNLLGKEHWLKEHFPMFDFIGVNMKKYKDKASVDMSDGILVDDSSDMLKKSNAKIKLCFGEVYQWNEDWDGERVRTWVDLKNYLDELNPQEQQVKTHF